MSEIFYPYQQRWVTTDSRFKVGMFARQTGKTFTTTFEVAKDCQVADIEGRRARWVILSRGERQAREAMEEGVKRHCQAMGAVIKAVETEYRGDATYKALEVVWPNGSKITALPANPDTARGFSANVFLDEFAFHQDSRKIWTALFPVISAGWKLRVVSTPNGKDNKFYDLMTGDDPVWYRQTTDIYQAVNDGLPRNIEELKRALDDEDAWAQEFELKWLDEASAWLSFELINAVEHEKAGDPSQYAGGPCFVGVDIGARKDLFVIYVLEAVGDVMWTREIIAKKRISFAEQDALLDEVMARYRVARCCMDQTGMGEKPVEDAQRRHGTYRVEGVLFNLASKLMLATVGKEAFEDRKIRIPMGDAHLRADLHKLKKVPTATGAPRFMADSDSAGHADRTWACFLALHAAGNPAGPIEFESTGRRTYTKLTHFMGARNG
ncbi:MAG: terminase family protein [Desulfobacterales bacterium]|jgi:phage FluMu gp28-like protein|nr:terminase family protein [Desulfobacterales bacterium]